MSGEATEPKILQPENRVRYLKIIAIFKITKGVLLLGIGFSILFLNTRTTWLDAISDWASDEILLKHSRVVVFLLSKLQEVLAGGALHATGLLALFYSAILFTEGIGVYLQKRWAEYFMVFATAALIPLEVRQVFHRPGIAAVTILLINCFIVWFLYRVLKREPAHVSEPHREVVVETR